MLKYAIMLAIVAGAPVTAAPVAAGTTDGTMVVGDAPKCSVDADGHTVIQYAHAFQLSFKCSHSGSTCSCTNAHPTHATGGCMEFTHTNGKTFKPHGDCTDSGLNAIDGGWSTYTYGTCSKSCGTGSQSMTRACDSPAPFNGGAQCAGSATSSVACDHGPCPVHCATSAFSAWSACTAVCATGTQSRSRTITQTAEHGGYTCPYLKETQNCNTQACPINGGWSGYGALEACSVTHCGQTGTRTKRRTCTNPAPAHGGANCAGSASDSSTTCSTAACPINGGWSGYGGWGGCSKTCGGGIKYRSRSCTNPSPAHGGAGCSGGTTDSTSCNTQACVAASCSANGMQAHYTFDGHWSASSTGSHNWGTAKHGSSYAVTGKHDTALNFDGNDRIQIHANGQVSETNFGVSMWFKTANSNAGGLFCVSLNGAHDRHFGIASNRIYIRTWPHGGQHPGTSGMASNTWRHAVYTVGPSGEKIFVDGTLIHHRGHVRSSSYGWDDKAWIGWSDDRGYFHGQIDDVRIFNNELSQSEVSGLYRGCS